MTVYKVHGIWRYRFMHKGKRYFEVLPDCDSKTDAKAAEERRKVRVREGQDAIGPDVSTNFQSFVKDNFLPWVETNKSPGTYQSYKWRSDDLIEAFGKFDLNQVSTFGVEKFKREELKRKTKRGEIQTPASVNRSLQVLASIFTRAEELGLIKYDIRPKIEALREDNQRIRYLTVTEERALVGAAAEIWPYLAYMITVDCATGLRREELFSLRKEDVDLTLNLVNVLDGKGGKARTVPLDPAGQARAIIERLIIESRSEYIFTSPHSGRKFTRVDKSLKRASELAQVSDVTIHVFRHTFCTRLAAAGVDVRTIQALAGHEDISTTMKYIHLVEANTHEAIRKLTQYSAADCHKFATTGVVGLKKQSG